MSALIDLLQAPSLSRYRAFELCMALGRLHDWLLNPEVIDLARREAGDMFPEACGPGLAGPPTESGSCWVTFVRQGGWPNLRSAFALPVRWRAGVPDDPRLPAGLRELARDVCRVAGKLGWGLGYADDVADHAPDLGGLPVTAGSGWVPLYGGLMLATDDLQPVPTVWATGAWHPDRGIQAVDGIAAKAGLARSLGAVRLFVPAGQEPEEAIPGLDFQGLPRLGTKSLSALDGYLETLGAPPTPPHEVGPEPRERAFARCLAYWSRHRVEKTRDEAYQKYLLPEIIRRCREQVRGEFPGWRPDLLITVISDNPENAEIMAAALGVSRTILLHTPDRADRAGRVKLLLEAKHGIQAELGVFTHKEEMAEAIFRTFPQRVVPPADRIVVDYTPGTKLMTLELDRLARQQFRGGWVVYLNHEYNGRRRIPGTERVSRWLIE